MSRERDTRVDYDQVAPIYDARFAYYAGARRGVGAALVNLLRERRAQRVLEVGCGTGHWLRLLDRRGGTVYGLDLSLGMLRRARSAGTSNLVRGNADGLPFRSPIFDLVFCTSALHHFGDAARFIRQARALLRPEGALAVIGMNPHGGRDRWYLYEYFPGTQATDLARYPASGTLVDWMIAAGFESVRWQVVERLRDTRTGRDILGEPMLQKNATSQLTLLSDEEYAAGMARIRAAIAKAESMGEAIAFPVDISLHMVVGFVGTRR